MAADSYPRPGVDRVLGGDWSSCGEGNRCRGRACRRRFFRDRQQGEYQGLAIAEAEHRGVDKRVFIAGSTVSGNYPVVRGTLLLPIYGDARISHRRPFVDRLRHHLEPVLPGLLSMVDIVEASPDRLFVNVFNFLQQPMLPSGGYDCGEMSCSNPPASFNREVFRDQLLNFAVVLNLVSSRRSAIGSLSPQLRAGSAIVSLRPVSQEFHPRRRGIRRHRIVAGGSTQQPPLGDNGFIASVKLQSRAVECRSRCWQFPSPAQLKLRRKSGHASPTCITSPHRPVICRTDCGRHTHRKNDHSEQLSLSLPHERYSWFTSIDLKMNGVPLLSPVISFFEIPSPCSV